jgi:hypothetical protein
MQHNIIVHDVVQGSDEWLNLRLGKITASCFYKLQGTKAAREKYLCEKASEIILGSKSDQDEFVNIHIKRGQEIGLIQSGEYIACSPDGLVDKDGMIEIKCPDVHNYLFRVLEITKHGVQGIPKEHLLQMQFCLYLCNRKWCDYILYNKKHAKSHNPGVFVYRIYRDESIEEDMKKLLNNSVAQIKEYVEQYHEIFTIIY